MRRHLAARDTKRGLLQAAGCVADYSAAGCLIGLVEASEEAAMNAGRQGKAGLDLASLVEDCRNIPRVGLRCGGVFLLVMRNERHQARVAGCSSCNHRNAAGFA